MRASGLISDKIQHSIKKLFSSLTDSRTHSKLEKERERDAGTILFVQMVCGESQTLHSAEVKFQKAKNALFIPKVANK